MKRLMTILVTAIVTLSLGQGNCDVTQADIHENDFWTCSDNANLATASIKQNEIGVWSVQVIQNDGFSSTGVTQDGYVYGIDEDEKVEVTYTVSDGTSCPSTEDRVKISHVGAITRARIESENPDTIFVCKNENYIQIKGNEVNQWGSFPEQGTWSGELHIQNPYSNIIDVDVSSVTPGNYKLFWTINNGVCQPSQDEIIVSVLPLAQGRNDCKVITSTQDVKSSQKLTFYPNPVSGNEITIEGEELKLVTITNQLGQVVLNKNIEQSTVDISKLEKGMYIISVSTSSGDIYTEKLIKE